MDYKSKVNTYNMCFSYILNTILLILKRFKYLTPPDKKNIVFN